MKLLNRLFASFQSRILRPWQLGHFSQTVDGKNLRQFKDSYSGQRCFFIGNGPSLRSQDLTKLHEASEITFGFNRIYKIFDQTVWRPTFYISQDEKMLGGCFDIVNTLDLPHKFVPIQMEWFHDIHIKTCNHFNMIEQCIENPLEFKFSDDISKGIYNSSTGMYTAAQLAAYMGFKQIYFIGVDHHFHISQNNKGEIIIDNKVKDYFSDKYNIDKEKLFIPNTERSTLTYVAMKNHCDSRGIQVFNATRGGKLEVFDRISFNSLF